MELKQCYGCSYFSISWNTNFPYSCSLLNIRSKKYPCLEVMLLNKKKKCPFFVKKKERILKDKKSNKKLDIFL